MAKYSFAFKKQIVQEYLDGKGSYVFIAKKYGLPDKTPLLRWVAAYKEFGDDGLMRSREQKNYSFEFKLHVVELYLTNEISYQELALRVGINNPSLITRWVNDFRMAGPDALRAKRKGRKPEMSKPKSNPEEKPETNHENTEYIKQLEDELLKLRIENAFLKELRRLRLEDEAKMRELQKSSTVSEDNFN